MKKGLKQQSRYRRHRRIRAKIFGTACLPRLCVFRSAKHIYAQLIDDETGKTLVSASEQELRKKKGQTPKDSALLAKRARPTVQAKIERAKEVGKLIAKKTLEKKIEKVIFDRGGYKYHGRVKALAEAARQGGLKF